MQLNAPDATERSIPTNQDTLAKKCSTEAHTCDGVVWQSMQKRCEVGGWSVYFDKYILQFGQICFLFRQIQILSGTKIQVWLTRVTDRTVPWLPSTTSSQLPQGFVLCVTLICISHYICICIFIIFVLCVTLICICHYNLLYQYHLSSSTTDILLLFFVCLRICATKMLQWGPFVESTLDFQCFRI